MSGHRFVLADVILPDGYHRSGPSELFVVGLVKVGLVGLREVVLRRRMDQVTWPDWSRVSGRPLEVDAVGWIKKEH